MYIPKRYGQSKVEECPFCGKQAIVKNKQGLNVCQAHIGQDIPDIRCVCGSYLELKTGKFGPYFVCINCGNINLKKGLEMQTMQKKEKPKVREEKDGFIVDPGKYPGFDYGID
jgi:predicted RNA-binding Zn-ribbon protein involved in translation (DUF1610 family)